ncbi:MAG: peptidase S8, partial [Nitrospirae bacterium]
AATGNHVGIAAPFAGPILPVRVLGSRGTGKLSDVADGIDWAVAHGARVINLSLGTPFESHTLEDSVKDAWRAGAVVVAAAGNAGERQQLFPAGFNEAISVSAWAFADDDIAEFASYHRTVELTAPGEHIYSAFLQGGYQLLSGSSMATPFVSGVAAALLAARPELTNECLRELLHETAEDVRAPGRDDKTGFGLVRFDRAVAALDTFTCP